MTSMSMLRCFDAAVLAPHCLTLFVARQLPSARLQKFSNQLIRRVTPPLRTRLSVTVPNDLTSYDPNQLVDVLQCLQSCR
jgi:hypothetical protein